MDRNAAPGIITNTSRISGTGLDEFTRIVSNSVSVQPVLDNTRTIVGVRPTGLVARGGTLEYTIVVRNEGTATARDVQVVEQLPAGTIFFPGTLVINGVPQGDVFELEPIDLGDIDPGKEGRVILEARIRSSASAGVLTSVVEISGAGIAPFTRSVSSNLSAERSITAAGKVEGTVLLQRRNDHSGTVVTFEGPQVKVVETDADGSFSATLEAGHYTVRAEHAYHLPAITEIDVQQGQVLVLNATLRCCDVDMDGVISIVDLVLQAQNFNISESEWR